MGRLRSRVGDRDLERDCMRSLVRNPNWRSGTDSSGACDSSPVRRRGSKRPAVESGVRYTALPCGAPFGLPLTPASLRCRVTKRRLARAGAPAGAGSFLAVRENALGETSLETDQQSDAL
jgi:hypothetical protein